MKNEIDTSYGAYETSSPVVVDFELYKRKRDISSQLVRSRVPLYVSHFEGRADVEKIDLASRMATIDAQIEEMNDLLYLLNQDEDVV